MAHLGLHGYSFNAFRNLVLYKKLPPLRLLLSWRFTMAAFKYQDWRSIDVIILVESILITLLLNPEKRRDFFPTFGFNRFNDS